MSRRPARMPKPGVHPTTFGVVEARPGDAPGQWTLLLDGLPSSPIDTEHPERLAFEYLAWMDAAVQAHLGSGTRVDAVHLGGAGCALAWAWAATRPSSTQLVVELDGELARLVREWFDLPTKPALRIRVGDAREVLESRRDASADVVVRDVFSDGLTPAHVTTGEFVGHVARVLRPGGLYLANIADGPPLLALRREIATVCRAFPHVAVVAESGTLRGRRFANSVCVASDAPLDESALHRLVGRVGVAVTVVTGERLRAVAGTALPLADPSADR